MTQPDLEDTLALALDLARKAGADAADALLIDRVADSAAVRLGTVESVERSQAREIGLRVFQGRRQAVIATAQLDAASLQTAADRAVAMAQAAPEDIYAGLPDRLYPAQNPALDLADPTPVSAETLRDWALECEDAARAVPGVTNSEGGGADATATSIALANSLGFSGQYHTTRFTVSASVLAEKDGAMVRDYDYARRRHVGDLPDIATIGRKAGERATARLGARKAKSTSVPVVFDPRVGRSLLGHFLGAIAGPAVARGTSFLKDRIGERVFAPGIRITDDPLLKRGLSSRPFDGESLPTAPCDLVQDGILHSWLLNLSSARQLDLAPTGHASRSLTSAPGTGASNCHMVPGTISPQALMADIDQGLYVTELIGMGVNPVTGDYSRGAAGLWIEKGALTYPVHEITIAGNLIDMFSAIIPADDLVREDAVNTPTLRIDGMTLAGE